MSTLLLMRSSHHETVFRSIRVIQSSGPLTALLGVLVVLLVIVLAVPVLLLMLAIGLISLPFVLAARAIRSLRKPNHALDGRRNVRVIQRTSSFGQD